MDGVIVRMKAMQHFYFDHNATTPVSPEVLEAMVSCLGQVYGNASSIHHFGQMAKQRLETARRQSAALIGCDAREIVFMSGGTEADNLAIFGMCAALRPPGGACDHQRDRASGSAAAVRADGARGRRGDACAAWVRWSCGSGDVRPRVAAGNCAGIGHACQQRTRVRCSRSRRSRRLRARPASAYMRMACRRSVRFRSTWKSWAWICIASAGTRFTRPKGVGALYVRQGT